MSKKKNGKGEADEALVGLVHGGKIRFEGTSMDFWLPPHVPTKSIKRPIPKGE